LLVAALAAILLMAPGAANAAKRLPGCSTPEARGGQWPTFGRDASNTRFQAKEKVISPADAPFLTPVWAFATTKAGGAGDLTGTPIVKDGCVYFATNGGWVFSLNADNGKLVWKTKLPKGGLANNTVGVTQRRCKKVKRRVRVRRTRRQMRRLRRRYPNRRIRRWYWAIRKR